MTEFVKVVSTKVENYDTKTIEFEMQADARPGQFVMVWVPGAEEIPMSLSGTGKTKSITVKAIGPSTKRFHEIEKGDTMRVRGPYGNGYSLEKGKKYLIIGGGVGTASIYPAVEETGADTIIGARSDKDVIFLEKAQKAASNVWISTDDGSMGFHGNAVQLMREKLKDNTYDCVIACGPPIMLKFLYLACVELGQKCQLSLERHMKCGSGACGCCVIDGLRVCKDGPVFTGEQVAKMPEFGTVRRDECGRIIKK